MSLDTRTAQTMLENVIRDAILYALGARLAQQTSIAALRATGTAGASGSMFNDDDLITTSITGTVTGWRWSRASTAADNGTSIIKPNDVAVGQPGRWLSFTSAVRFAPTVGGNSTTLDQIASGPLARVIVLDKPLSQTEELALINGDVPAVIIESHGDTPKDATLNFGARWVSEYEFTVTVITQNLRDSRQAAQGSAVDGMLGANDIDGFIKALMGGTVLNAAFVNDQPILNVRVGHAENRYSDLGQRRVWRIRDYTFQVSEENPAAPNDTANPTDIFTQAQLTALNQQPAYDVNNYLVSGCAPTLGGTLVQSLAAGSTLIAGATVSYAGGAVTFSAYSDNYRDLTPDGVMHIVPVSVGAQPPAVTANALRIGVTTTNGSQVLGDALIAETRAPYGPNNDFPV